MAHVLFFTRNRSTSVEQVDDQTLRCSCRLDDSLTGALVEILVKLPDLEILEIEAEVYRSAEPAPPHILESLRRVVGVRIGPGMVKIMKGLIGDREDLGELIFMTEECCQAVILSFSKDDLASAPEDRRDAEAFYAELLKENVRLYNSCIAFAPGSPLVKGMESQGK